MMFALNSIVAFLFGLGFLFFPARVLGLLGTETFVSTLLVARLFGAAMLGLGRSCGLRKASPMQRCSRESGSLCSWLLFQD